MDITNWELNLPECLPSLTHPHDIYMSAISNHYGDEPIRKVYASNILEINEFDEPPYDLFFISQSELKANKSLTTQGEAFVNNLIGLVNYNDCCDKVGIKYLVKALKPFQKGGEVVQNFIGAYIKESLQTEQDIIEIAKKLALS